LQVSLVSKDSPMLDGLDTASIEMEEAKVLLHRLWNVDVELPSGLISYLTVQLNDISWVYLLIWSSLSSGEVVRGNDLIRRAAASFILKTWSALDGRWGGHAG
jgi:hypothetical protein